MKIGIINYNIGNLASVQNAFEAIGYETQLESDPFKLNQYDKLILPGVGAFGDAMENLKATQMQEALKEYAQKGNYILGICLGAQLFFEKSFEFGEHQGLGLLKGEVVKFQTPSLKIPHMGWNQCILSPQGKSHPLLKGIKNEVYLYFVHSYHIQNLPPQNLLAECVYGYAFAAIVAKDNILGIQPHPEKSHQDGLKILQNFARL